MSALALAEWETRRERKLDLPFPASFPACVPFLPCLCPHLVPAPPQACLWVASKLLSVRTAAPNRQLVCMATACAADVLSWRELEVCRTLDWDFVEILREAGLV